MNDGNWVDGQYFSLLVFARDYHVEEPNLAWLNDPYFDVYVKDIDGTFIPTYGTSGSPEAWLNEYDNEPYRDTLLKIWK